DDLAISDVEDAVSDGRNPSVVGDHDDGLLEISVQRLEQIQDFLAGLRVEFSRGLVREEQGRFVRQGNRDGDPLLLTAAHLVRPAVGRSIPPRMFKNVVLPHPEGPRIATSSPSWMCRSRPRKAMTSAFPVRYTLIKSLVRISGTFIHLAA